MNESGYWIRPSQRRTTASTGALGKGGRHVLDKTFGILSSFKTHLCCSGGNFAYFTLARTSKAFQKKSVPRIDSTDSAGLADWPRNLT
ncbi:hypothetical protein BaRGS_00012824 [Batillaria attramentaria]|uniref:Uncharacterized protein n=1 Tax=Batillaria attramentaria TaxID=370345 RepID=A0ABD0L9M3_9CAEN